MPQLLGHLTIPQAGQAHREPAPVTQPDSMPKKRKAPPRAAKRDPHSLDELLTSSNSRLIDIDLHGKLASFFSDPQNWAQLSDTDKDFIRTLLPPHVELNDDGSIPTTFWKYNPEFRLDCRNLQEDLRSGRMDPEWQRQAAQAMEERAAGKFDDFKEREFEEFWGQKQKVAWDVLAGHASKVRLEELLKEGLFRVGDVWSFGHTWGSGEDAVRVEKDCKIVKIDGKSVTLAIPNGQLKFPRRLEDRNSLGEDKAPETPVPTATSGRAVLAAQDTSIGETSATNGEIQLKEGSDLIRGSAPTTNASNFITEDTETEVKDGVMQQKLPGESDENSLNGLEQDTKPESGSVPEISTPKPDQEVSNVSSELSSLAPSPSLGGKTTATISDKLDHLSAATEYDVILYEITGLYALERKILEIDGRAKPGSRTGSTWRDIRCRRDEQDMGSLFEMRDEYYAYKVAKGSYRPEIRSK
ncbi:MAG: hypothetical protein Q9225_007518 [Loekoesia sp. 1 TL-2023]